MTAEQLSDSFSPLVKEGRFITIQNNGLFKHTVLAH
jgi:hypothetical protein